MALTTPRESLLPHEVNYVIYHKNCNDGFGSAFVAWLFSSGKNIVYYPVSIGMDPPREISGKNVLICDFSFDEKVIEKMLGKVKKLLILDHHQTSEKKLANLHSCYKVFDMKKSGVELTWDYFFPGKTMPLMIQYIGDDDTWRHELPLWRDFAAWFYVIPKIFEEYAKYVSDESFLDQLKKSGPPLREFANYQIAKAAEHAVIKFCRVNKSYYFIAYLNSTTLASEIGNYLVTKHSRIDFAVIYCINDKTNSTHFSLRSTNQQQDVGTLAAALGAGGGHRNASGYWGGGLLNTLPGIVYDLGIDVIEQVREIYLDGFHAVAAVSDRYRHKLGAYLLQNRTIKEKKKFIDEIVQIGVVLSEAVDAKKFDLAVVISPWLGSQDCRYTLTFSPDASDDFIEKVSLKLKLDEKSSFIGSTDLIRYPRTAMTKMF